MGCAMVTVLAGRVKPKTIILIHAYFASLLSTQHDFEG